jgi:hypothetical protein
MAADPTQEEEDRSPSFEEADEVIEAGGYYLCSGVGHDGKEQCRFIALCTGAEDASADGVFWHGEFISSSCPYWQYWMNNPGVEGCVAERHVFHACAADGCDVEYPGGDEEVVHTPWWVRVDESKAMSIIVDWHAADEEIEWPETYLGEIPAPLVARWANRAPRPPPGAGRGRAGAAAPPGGAPASSAPLRLGVTAKAAGPPSAGSGLKRGRQEEIAGVGAALSRAAAGAASAGPPHAVGGTRTPPGGDVQAEHTGLPAVGVWGGGAPAGGSALGLSASAAKRPRSVSGGNDSRLADVLAARAQERSAAAPSPSADSDGGGAEAVVRLLARALQPGVGASDPDGLGLTGSLGSSGEGGVPGGLAAKRAHYRRVAAEHPGRLFRAGLTTMAEQLSPLDGGEYSSEVPPIALKYLLTTFLPQNPVKAIGSDMYRQLRTLAEAMDALIEGRVPAALDLLMQRFKACQLSLQDRSWAAARWLELIPATEGQTAVSPADEELAQQITLAELRLSKLRQDLQG